jgi:hypothetical protein
MNDKERFQADPAGRNTARQTARMVHSYDEITIT